MTLRLDIAMLMAAGLGKRMRPLTVTRPKPLVRVAGQALIDHALDKVEAAGIRRSIINVHYLADSIEAHLQARARQTGADYVISDERGKLLETGGGLVKALPLIGDKPFLCVNADVLWVDGPTDAISALCARWNPAIMDALLLLIPFARANGYPGRGDFHMDPQGRISRRKSGRVAPFVYCSVQILSPRLIVDPPSDIFSTGVFWDRAIAAGRAYGLAHTGMWFDVGTPQAIPLVEAAIASE
ncbi:nucleotidyltransferase family protein [Sphingobium nicotianae]|uniref:Nucleotidyltransferase family protein n=1 Tax=Sphingobium nicotianae TaxID=2782607 RepID=A0A9X1DG36_9SPHN|nr:nucleotidyltransferase family protein [Sphingobium nicotianae]MBT2189307.1 nucleotidyltransferase family protein [Sphingobium nicotianae]